MAMFNKGLHHSDPSTPSTIILPPWLTNSGATSTIRPTNPSVTLSLSPTTMPPSPAIPWLQPERANDNSPIALRNFPSHGVARRAEDQLISELVDCCQDLEEGNRAWAVHKKEAAWRVKRVELQLESEKASRKREKLEEIEAKVNALREEEKVTLERIEAEYREQLANLRRDAETKEQKLSEQWVAKHLRLTRFLEQMGCRSIISESNGR